MVSFHKSPWKAYFFYFILGWLPSVLYFISFYSPKETWQHWFPPMMAGEILNLIDLKFRISCKLDTWHISKTGNFIFSSWRVIAAPQYDSFFFLRYSTSNQLSHFCLLQNCWMHYVGWRINLSFQMKHLNFLLITVAVRKHMFFPLTIPWILPLWILWIPEHQQKPPWL